MSIINPIKAMNAVDRAKMTSDLNVFDDTCVAVDMMINKFQNYLTEKVIVTNGSATFRP